MLRSALFPSALLSLAFAAPLQAQQVVIADVTYTATADNTDDSHYRIEPAAETPDDWESPVDYAHGRVHVRFEVFEKPSAEVTLLNVCFEATPSYACMPYSDPYTATGVYDYEYDFEIFYQYAMVDWSQGTNTIALILKDKDEHKPQGDPAFYPTRMRVTITLVAEGHTYNPPLEPEDAGIEDAGAMDAAVDAAVSDASTAPPASGGSGGSGGAGGAGGAMMPPQIPSGGAGGLGGAGGVAGVLSTGGAGGAGGAATATPPRAPEARGCSVAQPSASDPRPSATLLIALGLLALRGSARRPRHVR